MEHKGTVLIETERLVLRQFAAEDYAAMYRNWAKDSDVTKYLTWPPHSSEEVSKKITDIWVESYSKPDYYQWAIVPKNGKNEPIGAISVVRIDESLNIVEIGYCIGKAWWNQGIMSEAFSGIIPFLFEDVKVNRITAGHDVNNPNSGKVMLKCGLKYEGTLRQSGRNNCGIVDMSIYGMIAQDYFAGR